MSHTPRHRVEEALRTRPSAEPTPAPFQQPIPEQFPSPAPTPGLPEGSSDLITFRRQTPKELALREGFITTLPSLPQPAFDPSLQGFGSAGSTPAMVQGDSGIPVGRWLNEGVQVPLGLGFGSVGTKQIEWLGEEVAAPAFGFLGSAGTEVMRGVEGFAGDIVTQVTGRGFRGERFDVQIPFLQQRRDVFIRRMGYLPFDIRELAARTFEIPESGTINDPVLLREMDETREARRVIRLAEAIERQPDGLAEIAGQMLGALPTFGRGQEPLTLEAIGKMHPALQALIIIPSVGAVAGPAAARVALLGRPMLGAFARTGAVRVGAGALTGLETFAKTQPWRGPVIRVKPPLTKEQFAAKARRIAESEKLAEQHAGAMEVAQYVKPARDQLGTFKPVRAADPSVTVLEATEPLASTSLIGFRPIQAGLTQFERLLNVVRNTVGKIGSRSIPLDHYLVTPAMRERGRVLPIIESQANRLAAKHHFGINNVFRINKKGGIEDLEGKDPTLPGAPTIADVAARFPTYRRHLSEAQLAALRELEKDLAPYRQMLEEAGVEFGVRTDIMNGGFYIPRGRALEEGLDAPVRFVGTGRSGVKMGAERHAEFDSMAEGIGAGWEYALIGEVLENHAGAAGRRALDLHLGNYLKSLRDDLGKPLGLTPADLIDLIDPTLRTRVQTLGRKIAQLRKTLAAQNTRGAAMSREAL